MTTTAPYGTWKSPIGADLITQKSIVISELFVDLVTSEVFHSEARPSEGGRNVIVRSRTDKDAFNEEWNSRTGVHEYGGGAAMAFGSKVYFSDGNSRRIHVIDDSSANARPTPVTPDNDNWRYANFAVFPSQPHLLVAVKEDHTKPAPSDVVNTLSLINTRTQEVTELVNGADFYSSPTFSPDGKRLAWLQWHHPDMPWEGTELLVAHVEVISDQSGLVVSDAEIIAGQRDKISVNEPLWVDNDTLIYQSDISGYNNPQKYSISTRKSSPILSQPTTDEYSDPAKAFGWSRMAVLTNSTILASPIRKGFSLLVLIDITTGSVKELDNPFVTVSMVRRVSSTSAVFIGIENDDAPALVHVDLDSSITAKYTIVKATSKLAATLPPGFISESVSYTLREENLHVIVTSPKNANYSAPEGEKPPAVVNIHGGPTGRVAPGLSWIAQHFTSRGWAWVDVNYGGSSGYGREYRERLRGNWGVTDVTDAVDTVKELGERGIIDSSRAVIRGASAGGYTVLMALCTPESATVFSAGTSLYGISDVKMLVRDTHKFESHYAFKLFGGTPEEVPEVYKARSAVYHADKIKAPLLLLQGSEDKAVPPNQAESMVKVIKEQGGQVDYLLFKGEGHGFRRAENLKKALETERSFYERIFNLTPTL